MQDNVHQGKKAKAINITIKDKNGCREVSHAQKRKARIDPDAEKRVILAQGTRQYRKGDDPTAAADDTGRKATACVVMTRPHTLRREGAALYICSSKALTEENILGMQRVQADKTRRRHLHLLPNR